MKKSPNKPRVMIEENITDVVESDVEEAGSESPNEEMDTNPIKSGDESSGADGDNSDCSDVSDASNDDNDKTKANPGWADAMRKILNTKKPKKKKTIVLSKAKKLNEVTIKEIKTLPFQLEGENGEIKVEEVEVEKDISDKKSENKHKRKDQQLKIRVKPSVLDREKERILQKIATKGVVQLFNAVKQQQSEIDDKLSKVGSTESKREKVLKNIDRKAFLDVLMGGTKSIAVEDVIEEKTEKETSENVTEKNKVWDVLRDDFVMGAKLKDWNKKTSDSESSSDPENIDSD